MEKSNNSFSKLVYFLVIGFFILIAFVISFLLKSDSKPKDSSVVKKPEIITKAETKKNINRKDNKFLGNVINDIIPYNFLKYWNQVTPENGTKWGSIEQKRDVMNSINSDSIYQFAKDNNLTFKFHTLIWGSQQPEWMEYLSTDEQREEIIEWFEFAKSHFPDSDYIDVVNEPLHAPPFYMDAIGGKGTSKYDWIIWSFKKARELFPNSKLLINDYGIINNPDLADDYIKIINVLKTYNLIDGIGIQCHEFNINVAPVEVMKEVLDKLSKTNLPIYVSELDISGDDIGQLELYKEKFPILWEHPNVKGVTLWGYIQNLTWKPDTHLYTLTNEERPAFKWLREYILNHQN